MQDSGVIIMILTLKKKKKKEDFQLDSDYLYFLSIENKAIVTFAVM